MSDVMVVLKDLSPEVAAELKAAIASYPRVPVLMRKIDPTRFKVAAFEESNVKRARKKVMRDIQRGTPLEDWDDEILYWSKDYWADKLKDPKSKAGRPFYKRAHDDAVTEIVRRTLVKS